jgi:hypothetical protein
MTYCEDQAAYYRCKAEEATRAAQVATDPRARETYEEIARSWLQIAKQFERKP